MINPYLEAFLEGVKEASQDLEQQMFKEVYCEADLTNYLEESLDGRYYTEETPDDELAEFRRGYTTVVRGFFSLTI